MSDSFLLEFAEDNAESFVEKFHKNSSQMDHPLILNASKQRDRVSNLQVSFYTTQNALIAASNLLQACCVAVIKPISGFISIAFSGLMITKLLQVVNRIDAN